MLRSSYLMRIILMQIIMTISSSPIRIVTAACDLQHVQSRSSCGWQDINLLPDSPQPQQPKRGRASSSPATDQNEAVRKPQKHALQPAPIRLSGMRPHGANDPGRGPGANMTQEGDPLAKLLLESPSRLSKFTVARAMLHFSVPVFRRHLL